MEKSCILSDPTQLLTLFLLLILLEEQLAEQKVGVVFHTHYTGDVIPEMQARAGAKINGSEDVLVVKNDTPMHRVGLSRTEMNTFDRHVSKIESMCRSCGDFLDELVSETGTTGDAKFHIASYLKQFSTTK